MICDKIADLRTANNKRVPQSLIRKCKHQIFTVSRQNVVINFPKRVEWENFLALALPDIVLLANFVMDKEGISENSPVKRSLYASMTAGVPCFLFVWHLH